MSPSHATTKQRILHDMAAAIESGNWQSTYALLDLTRAIKEPEEKADVLNNLLVTPGHELHQEVTREIQKLRSPSSVPYIRHVLAEGFHMLEYTCSEPGVIAKWFSHALGDINTPESIALIKEFSASSNQEVAEEMAYRLERLNA
ncbi:hypothetical protein LRS03_26005 [Rhizobacter sp. J219]|uniref:hypothetical protein n=1 Tax=Rhizobacter sp. J219 TaxID=2898430 RepID=UPI00215131C2|nr:hypothetical protein [Rhizobacter sp. J219]MCR5886120.1 hypothetical protein [Rhizobacter sp. J219]